MGKRRFMGRGAAWGGLPPLLITLSLAACHAPRPAGMALAQAETRWDGLPVRTAALQGIGLTLYADGWGLVSQAARLSLESGSQIVRLSPVAAQTEPRGAYLQVPAPVSDRRFRFDLASKERLQERYHGRTVEIVTATGSITATLLMTETGPVYRVGDRLMTDPPGKVVFPPLPGLALDPALEWIVNASAPWSGEATASYVANRLGWQSEFTLVTDADQTRGDWTQWAAIHNQSGARYADAQVTLVAGDVRRDDRAIAAPYGGVRAYRYEADTPEPYAAKYQIRLPRPLTLENNREERVTLGRASATPLTRSFRVVSAVALYAMPQPELPRKALIRLTVPNTEAAGLGVPLPRGKVTVYTPNARGELAIAGEPSIPDTPKGQAVFLELGEAFDVTAERRQVRHEVTTDGTRVGMRIALRNQQAKPVTVDVIEQLPGDWTVESHSDAYDRLSASELRFRPSVPAGGELTLTYTVLIRSEKQPRTLPQGIQP